MKPTQRVSRRLTRLLVSSHSFRPCSCPYKIAPSGQRPLAIRGNISACQRQSFSSKMPRRIAPTTEVNSDNRTETFKAAPEIDLDNFQPSHQRDRDHKDPLKNVRIVPASRAYFSGLPTFTDDALILKQLLEKYHAIPTVPASEARRTAWHTLESYRSSVKERIRVAKYNKVIVMLNRLNRIHPDLMPEDVSAALGKWTRVIQPFGNRPNPIEIDEFGRAMAIGRRKSASAKAWVVMGDGQVLVNDKPLHKAFGRIHDRESAVWPLKVTERLSKYNVYALATGGGTTGQAEAITLAVAKALMAHEPALKSVLRRAGCITRDARKVERKKPGLLKARKRPAWVKR